MVAGRLDLWVGGAAGIAVLFGVLSAYVGTAKVIADEDGLRTSTLLRRRRVRWDELADLRVRERDTYKNGVVRQVEAVLDDGRVLRLPLPVDNRGHADFDRQVQTLRSLLRCHRPEVPERSTKVTRRTAADRQWVPVSICLLLLLSAGLLALMVPYQERESRAWRSASACSATTPQNARKDCLDTAAGTIDRTMVDCGKHGESWLYFAGNEPLQWAGVGCEDARAFRQSDRVAVTFWHDQVVKVAGTRHTYRAQPPQPGAMAMIAAGLLLGACYPAARVLVRLRHRRRPADEVLPTTLPFLLPILGTAVWLLPLAFLRPSGTFAIPIAAVGAVATLLLVRWAWRATAIRTPGVGAASGGPTPGEDVYVRARFLDDTPYNPHEFGGYIVFGDGPMAVVLGPAAGRFGAKPIPAERITVRRVRRVVGGDGDAVPASWNVAELDDAGTPIRLAAAPADLQLLLQQLQPGHTAPLAT
ncbi:PH domain-containing protein [Actinomadura barringtoniae]|uniref:PH domain-containing protein n=1 Tax=Actinomadura barringtoniae TaxID=1427535 RepID=A0A939PAF6_9ACTN|nr:PH domain-containing protein [Actinomadura barringtoniae]MBO2445979.1 PH domain-containing protein [Actinomadura barringtoniae]